MITQEGAFVKLTLYPKGYDWSQAWPQLNGSQRVLDMLDRAYDILRQCSGIDVNAQFKAKLEIRHDYSINDPFVFVFDGMNRPMIKFKATNDEIGSASWFGGCLHELGHDFFHENFFLNAAIKAKWGDGLCDVVRFHLLAELGLTLPVGQFFVEINGKPLNDRYGEPARKLLDYQSQYKLLFGKLIAGIKGKDLSALLGNPTW